MIPRHPWGFWGTETVRVQRHLCHACQQTYEVVVGTAELVLSGGAAGGGGSLAAPGRPCLAGSDAFVDGSIRNALATMAPAGITPR